jgi:hypothetical protein
MAFKYTVAMMDTASEDGMDDVVKTLHYRITMIDVDVPEGTLIPFRFGTVDLASPDAGSFVEFANLDAATVEAWLKSKLDCTALEAGLSAELSQNASEAATPTLQTTSKMPSWA